jgi:hypothetical protein
MNPLFSTLAHQLSPTKYIQYITHTKGQAVEKEEHDLCTTQDKAVCTTQPECSAQPWPRSRACTNTKQFFFYQKKNNKTKKKPKKKNALNRTTMIIAMDGLK